ncbi:MAG TPA: hypothetical protein PLC99_25955 [Verrucomicrobiota bacterium]|nr:hypothetical protein [Verrucomicrobiota bacterium]
MDLEQAEEQFVKQAREMFRKIHGRWSGTRTNKIGATEWLARDEAHRLAVRAMELSQEAEVAQTGEKKG